MNPISATVGATVAGVVLLLVMVPVLDGMTQETMHGDDLNEGESYYYCPMVVWNSTEFPRNTGYIQKDSSTGVPEVRWQIDSTTSLSPQYTPPEAGIVMYFGEEGLICSMLEPRRTDGEFTPIWGDVTFIEYDTGIRYTMRNDRMTYEDNEFKFRTIDGIMSMGTWCYSLCPKELATMVGGTKMISSDGAGSLCFQYAAVESLPIQGATAARPVMLKYEPDGLSPGTYNALDLDGSELYMKSTVANGVREWDYVRDADASVTISTTSHANVVELNGFSGDYYHYRDGKIATLYGGTHMVIVPYEQTWTSEYRDIVMVIPVLVAVAILMNVGMMLYNRRN